MDRYIAAQNGWEALAHHEQLKSPEHEIVTIKAQESDIEASQRLRSLMTRMAEGRYGKKVMLKLESAQGSLRVS